MTLVSDDPIWWPLINASQIGSYFIVAASAGVMYDWVLTFTQEIELIWKQRWSLMTVLYLSARYLGILYSVISIPLSVPTIPLTDVGCGIVYVAQNCMNGVVATMILGAIMVTRLYAMYQRSRHMLIFLLLVCLAVNVASVVLIAILLPHISAEELVLSGTHQCNIGFPGINSVLLGSLFWIPSTVWEVLTLGLAVWSAVKHFRELRRHSAGGIIGDCFTVLMKTHLIYFASVVAVSCVNLSYLSPTISADPYSLESQIYIGVSQILLPVQMFVLGPRLILGVREYHAELVADSDAAPGMASIVFQERVHVSTSSTV